jgi:hypothetical protein
MLKPLMHIKLIQNYIKLILVLFEIMKVFEYIQFILYHVWGMNIHLASLGSYFDVHQGPGFLPIAMS